MRKQKIICGTCDDVVVEFFDGEDGRRLMKYHYTMRYPHLDNGEITTTVVRRREVIEDVDRELADREGSGDSMIPAECRCAGRFGRPRDHSLPLRHTLEAIGTRRSLVLA